MKNIGIIRSIRKNLLFCRSHCKLKWEEKAQRHQQETVFSEAWKIKDFTRSLNLLIHTKTEIKNISKVLCFLSYWQLWYCFPHSWIPCIVFIVYIVVLRMVEGCTQRTQHNWQDHFNCLLICSSLFRKFFLSDFLITWLN